MRCHFGLFKPKNDICLRHWWRTVHRIVDIIEICGFDLAYTALAAGGFCLGLRKYLCCNAISEGN